MIRLYDAHNHLQDDRLSAQWDDIVATARATGIMRMVVNGSGVEDWSIVAGLARRYPDIVQPSFGVHPWHAHEQTADWLRVLREFVTAFPNSGIGEIGLDRWKPDLAWAGQEAMFTAQLQLAAELNRPASIHCLQAWGPLLNVLETAPRPARGILLHSYGGSIEMIPRLVQLGAYFSLPGAFAHERKGRQRETFRHVPPDRLLLETDAPDQPLPPERVTHPLAHEGDAPLNHPANLGAVYAFAAELLDTPIERLALRVEENTKRLFG